MPQGILCHLIVCMAMAPGYHSSTGSHLLVSHNGIFLKLSPAILVLAFRPLHNLLITVYHDAKQPTHMKIMGTHIYIHMCHFSGLAAVLLCLEQYCERQGLVELATVFLLGRLYVTSRLLKDAPTILYTQQELC